MTNFKLKMKNLFAGSENCPYLSKDYKDDCNITFVV